MIRCSVCILIMSDTCYFVCTINYIDRLRLYASRSWSPPFRLLRELSSLGPLPPTCALVIKNSIRDNSKSSEPWSSPQHVVRFWPLLCSRCSSTYSVLISPNSLSQYGCNLSLNQMSTRAPSAISVSLAILHHHRWVISARGLANIVPSPDHIVYGVVYSIPSPQIAALDDAEGVSQGLYQRLDIDVVMIYKDLNSTERKQVSIPCWTYIDRQSSNGVPNAEYIERINEGIQDAKLPNAWVAENIRVFIPKTPRTPFQALPPSSAPHVQAVQQQSTPPEVPTSAPVPDPASNSPTGVVVATDPPPYKLYFAYGSNLWLKQMKDRCPSSKKVGTGILHSYKWGINPRRYANVCPSSSHVVYGIVYTLSSFDEAELDCREGVSLGYYEKKDLDVELLSTEKEASTIRCLVYIDPKGLFGPSGEYIDRINSGLKDANLPKEWVQQNIRPFVPDK
jgi:gamma-glutamylcyclotransferase